MAELKPPTRILFSCSGVGIINRGIETFFREAFDGLKSTVGIECHLLKGKGEAKPDESPVWNLPRTGCAARWLGTMARRNAYVVEQWTSFLPVARHIRRFKPHVVFYSDGNLGFLLYWFRKQIGVPYRLLFSNGGPCHPPFIRRDFVHQVVPLYHEEALRAGESRAKHFMVPYGINVGGPPRFDPALRRSLRAKLGLPADRQIILSVGWISREHKRMDYVIQEVARLPQPQPFLQLLGAMDQESPAIIELGRRLLGPNNFAAASVPYEAISDYYRSADCFVLASLKEGFGRVYLEALMHGLPVIAHRHPVMDYVIGQQGILGDLEQPSGLAALLKPELSKPIDDEIMQRRWRSVRDRFAWSALATAYQEMFEGAATRAISW